MIFWIDVNHRKYWKSEIDNRYLMNIANALTRGVGHLDFCTAERIDNIFEECYLRGLMTAEEAHEKCEKALDAMAEKEENRYMLEQAEILYEEHCFGSDD